MSKKRVILLGRKAGAGKALSWLLKHNIEVPLVVVHPAEAGPESLAGVAKKHRIPVLRNSRQLYSMITKKDRRVRNIDLVISYLCAERIRDPLIKLGKLGCVNFHPAPLPDYKSRAGYSTAILDGRREYGVSTHYIDSEKFDDGPIITVVRFKMDASSDTAYSLEKKAQTRLFTLFEKTIPRLLKGKRLPTTPNKGGLYLTLKELEQRKVVKLTDSPEIIDRKIRAFFFPPYTGATIDIGGKTYTLVNADVLQLIDSLLKQK